MKKILSTVSLIAATAFFVACDYENKSFDTEGGITAFQFTSASANFGVSPTDFTLNVGVGVTTRSASARTYTVAVDSEMTTAPAGSFNVNTSSLVIPANSFNGSFEFNANFDLLPDSGNVRVVLVLTPSGGAGVMSGRERFTITLFRSCPYEESIAGAHTYSSYNFIRGATAPPNNVCAATPTGTVTWTATATPGLYSTSDMAFGMYQNCWNVGAGAVSASSRVEWICNNIRSLGADQYGDGFDYTVVSVAGNKMIIDWTNDYGDAGTAEITRAGGVNWPAILQD
jgi:hypothetical protein